MPSSSLSCHYENPNIFIRLRIAFFVYKRDPSLLALRLRGPNLIGHWKERTQSMTKACELLRKKELNERAGEVIPCETIYEKK